MKIGVLILVLATLTYSQEGIKAAEVCTVSGQVLNAETGEPLKSARVALAALNQKEDSHTYSAVTDEQGRFSIPKIPPGRYRFLAQHNGFVAKEYSSDATAHRGAILDLAPGQTLDKVLFRLTKAGVIVGRITDEDGQPAAGVEVEALVEAVRLEREGPSDASQRDVVPLKIAVTNDLGDYRLYGLPPARYYIAAIDSGMPELTDYNLRIGFALLRGAEATTNHPPMYFPGVTRRSEAQKLKVGPGEELRVDISLRPAKTVTVSGRVIGADGKPASRASVALGARDIETMFSSMRNESSADENGKFEIKGVLPGTYSLQAWQNHGDKRYSAEQKLEVAGEDISGLLLHLGGRLSIAGRVAVPAGSGVNFQGVHVWLTSPDGSDDAFGAADVKQDGQFKVDELPTATYSLSLTSLPDGWYLKSATFGDNDVLVQGLRLGEGGTGATLELTIAHGTGELKGTVVNGGDPVPGAQVELTPEHENPYRKDLKRTATTDQHGGFVIKNVVPGGYLVKAVLADDDDLEKDQADNATSAATKLALAEREAKTVRLEIATN